MGKRNYDSLLSNILGDAEIRPQDKLESVTKKQSGTKSQTVSAEAENTAEESWKHFTFICSIELIDKVQAIAHKEGFTIRAFMEYMMRQGITQYEAKHGKAKKIKVKNVNDVM